MGSIAAWTALTWAASLLGMVGSALVRRRRPGPVAHPERSPRLMVVRPCAGSEPGLQQRLESVAQNAYAGELRVVVAVSSATDTAVPAAIAAVDTLRNAGLDARVEVVVPSGPNRKASILARVLDRYGDEVDVLVSADSDVDLMHFDLTTLVGELLADERRAAVWVPTVESDESGLGSRASQAVLTGSLHAFALLSGVDPAGMVGKLFATRPSAIAAAGGAGALAHYLGEDMELSRRLRAAGFIVAPSRLVGRATVKGRSLREVIARHSRWMLVIRAQRPLLLLTYPLFFFPTLPQALLALLAWPTSPTIASAALLVGISARFTTAIAARQVSERSRGVLTALIDIVLSDAVLGLAWLSAIRTRSVDWRGQRLRIRADGLLENASEVPLGGSV